MSVLIYNILYRHLQRDITLIFLILKKCRKIISDHPVYYTYGTLALVALFPFICTFEYPQAASQTWFSQSERQQAALRVFPEIHLVPLRMCSIFFLPRRVAASTRKNIFDEKDRGERKKGQEPAARDVHAKLFKWAAPDGVAQEIRWNFAQNGKRAAGVLGYANSEIRDFMNDKASERGEGVGPPHRRKEGPTTRWKKDKDKSAGKRAKRASEPVTAWPYN